MRVEAGQINLEDIFIFHFFVSAKLMMKKKIKSPAY